ncbi:hypothetical protein BYT27DRAFT_7189503 [Phlegmacium glaucopus]|nr:hypothetical protein BYT27DRAFT_7189503 [Phlegmacium glaucopus]
MGSLCSKSSAHEGGHTVLGSGDAGSSSLNRPSDPRAAAAEAAERRVKLAQSRGTKGGKLAKQLAEQGSAKPVPQPREEERLVWD